MTKLEIETKLKSFINKFKKLPIHIQKDNAVVLKLFVQQYKSIKNDNIVYRNGVYHPQALFKFKNEDKCKSIKDYFETYGEKFNNIIGFQSISVLDSKTNQYIKLF
jgi:hypothetical protein